MLTGQCPSCGSKTVFMRQKGIEVGGAVGVVVHTTPDAELKPTSTDDYICTSCGYFERHLSNLTKLSEVEASWIPVAG